MTEIEQRSKEVLMEERTMDDTSIIPRLTHSYLETLIISEDYHHFPGTGTTVCCIRTKNGFDITATASCGSSYRFNFDEGKEITRRKAMNKLMEYEQYLLKQRLYEARLAKEDSIQ